MESRTIVLKERPPWLNNYLLDSIEESNPDLRVNFKFSPGEKHILFTQKQIPVSQWSEKYRVLEASSIRGKWQNLYTPYLISIMDAANLPGVETVIMCKSPQTGGSECGHNLVGYCIDRLPGPVMYVFPDEKTARENVRDRIIPMILSSPRLQKYLTGNPDDVSMYHIKLMHMNIYLAWSGSVSRLGNKPIRVLILDELDKYENQSNEARSEDLAVKRTTTWRSRRKIFKISTPTTEDGPIWQAFTEEANCRFRYFVKCPDCFNLHKMEFENIGWPKKGTTQEPKAEDVYAKNLAYYVCPNCGSIWNDEKRNLAVRAGEWREEETNLNVEQYILQYKPKKVGFHVPAWLSYFVSLSEIAMAYLKYKQTDSLAEFKNFQNQYAAEPWHESFDERSPEQLVSLCDDRPAQVVPSEIDGKSRVAALIAGIDTQLKYFRYVIRAIGYGNAGESWLIREGEARTFDELEDILLRKEYLDSNGERYKVKACIIDSQGEPRRSCQVYDWAKAHKGFVYPSRGVHRLHGGTWKLTNIEYYPTVDSKIRKIAGGLTVYSVDTTFYKNMLAQKLQILPESLGAFHLFNNRDNILAQYIKEMTAEYWDPEEKGGTWMCPNNKPNHAWDCEYLIQALADILYIRKWTAQNEVVQAKTVARPNTVAMRPSDRVAMMRARR